MYKFSENSKSRMQTFEEPQFGHPCYIGTFERARFTGGD